MKPRLTDQKSKGIEPIVNPHLSIQTCYWPTRAAAEDALSFIDPRFIPHARIREYTIGFAVQLHDFGDYLGPQINSFDHNCPWCPKS